MKLSYFTSALFLGCAAALPYNRLEIRNDKAVREAVTRVVNSIKLLSQHFTTKPQSPQQQESWVLRAVELQQDNTATLTYANTFVRAGPTLTNAEFWGLGTLTMPMHNAMTAAVNGWIAAKPYAVNVGAQDYILKELQKAQNEALGFAQAIWSKTSTANQAISNGLIGGITKNMEKAIAAYRPART